VFKSLCDQGFEGIVSKRADAPYRSGRTRSWLKVKCGKRQEFVIGGWTPSDKRAGFKSLLLGYYRGKDLVYAGRVGTGFDAERLRAVRQAQAAGAQDQSVQRSRSDGAHRPLGHAEAGGRDRLYRVHRRRHLAPPVVHRPEGRPDPRSVVLEQPKEAP
jgi:hypothetical protein